MRKTLRTRLVVLVVAALVPLIGLLIIKALHSVDAELARAKDNLQFAASLAAASQERVADSARQVLMVIASLPGMQDGHNVDCDRYLSSQLQNLPEYANLGIVGLDGYTRCHALGSDKKAFLGDRAYFRNAITQRRFVAGNFALGRLADRPVITFAQPVIGADDKVTGVVFASVDLVVMARSIAGIQLPAGAALGIQDREGTLLAGKPALPIQIGQKVRSPVLQEAVKTLSTGVREGRDGAGQERLWAFMPSSPRPEAAVFVSVSLDRDLIVGSSRRQLWLDVATLALMVLLGGWLAWMMGGRSIVKPAREFLDAVRQIQDGRLDVRIPNRASDEGELTRMAAGFNSMAESLERHHGEMAAELAHSQAVQEKLQDAQRLGRIGYWQVNLETRRFWWSDEVYDLLGVDRNGLDGSYESLLQRIHPADRAAYNAVHQAAVQTGKPQNVEFRVVTSAGEVRWIQLFARSDDKAEGQHHAGVLQDITERKLAENELRDSEQRYAALFEAAPVPMWVYDDVTLQFLAVNRAAIKNYGYSAEEFLSMTLFDIRPESENDRLRQKLTELVGWQKGVWHHRRKDGSVFPVEVFSKSVQHADRTARFVVALDISAQDKVEKEMAEHLFMLQRAADAAQAITWHQTLQGTLQEVAEQARGVIGAHQAAVILSHDNGRAQAINASSLSEKYADYLGRFEPVDGRGIRALVCETNRPLRLTQTELEAHPRWRGRDSQPFPMRGWLAVPLTARDGSNIGLLQLSDKYEGEFTPQDEYVAMELAQMTSSAIENARLLDEVNQLNTGLEQKVAERTAALRMANQELESFSYSVSHDLRSPLNTIDGFSQLLARQLAESDNEKAQHYLSRIRAGTAQMGQLIGDLLSLAQVARAQMSREAVDLSALSHDILDGLRDSQPERQVVVHIEPGLQVQGDAGLLRVVMENLLGNAWKYSSKQAEAEIVVGQQRDAAGEPVFFVQDNGAGFDMAYANKLFQPFQRLHPVAEFLGTGIGLATVSRVIDRHGGRIWAEAAPGRGATFFWTLPDVPVPGRVRPPCPYGSSVLMDADVKNG